MSSLVGQTIRGYELIDLIGQGGFGMVYRASQPQVGREVAIKIILPQYANHPEFIRRFEIEAQLIARLEHPFIVPLYDYWREPDSAYLVMRRLRGGSLRTMSKAGPLKADFVERSLSQIAAALAVAHRNGVIHRDLKPDNILLDEQGNAYLTDFGIAKDLANDLHITKPESLVGSYAYVSPEQANDRPVTAQTDLYSLGVVLYELLTGSHPFPGLGVAAMLNKHMNDPLPPLRQLRPDLPPEVDGVIQRATAKQSGARYPSALAMARAFRRAAQGREAINDSDNEVEELSTEEYGEGVPIEISGVEARVAVQTSTLSGIVTPEPDNPYRGLRAFQEADAVLFFGREEFIGQLSARMAEKDEGSRFLAVVGPSGSGKSSAVRAGLLPGLRHGALSGSADWYVVEMFPGAYPLEELEAALLRMAVNPPNSLVNQLREDDRGLMRAVKRVLPEEAQLFLFIDQFEEMFTLVEDEKVRAQFFESLYVAITDPHSQLRVVVTLRTDFYGHLLHYPNFSGLLRSRTEVIMPMTPDELRRAIMGPAAQVGLLFESGLVDLIMGDVKSEPGALPLVQYALTELFERRQKRRLTLEGYQASGGVLGALARRAEELYGQLDAAAQQAARQLFLRLVTLGEGTEDTRRRVLLSELTSVGKNNEAIQDVIDAFGKYRLLTFDRDPTTRDPTVEVAHEALIREWTQVSEWINASREDLRLQRRVATAAAEWLKASRDPSFLASGVRLQQFEAFVASTDLALAQEESEYIRASLDEAERLHALEKSRQAYEEQLENRSRFRLKVLVGVFALAAVLAFGLTVIALNQSQSAQSSAATATVALGQVQIEADRSKTQVAIASTAVSVAHVQQAAAEHNAEIANSLALATNAQRALSSEDPALALALALEANKIEQPPLQARRVLFEAAYAPGIRRVIGSHRASVRSVAFSPNGEYGLSSSDDSTLVLWDTETGQSIRTLSGHTASVWAVAFSPDGKLALSGAGRSRLLDAIPISDDNTMRLWDLQTGKELRVFTGHNDAVTSVAFSADGKTALSGSADMTLILWDVQTGAILKRFHGHSDAVLSVAFSPNQKQVVSASADKSLILWDIAEGQAIRHFEGQQAQVNTVAFSPDGQTILSGAGTKFSRPTDFVLILWDVATGAELRRFQGHTAAVTGVVFNPDGRTALSSSADKSLILWDVKSGKEIRRLMGHTDAVLSVAFSPLRHAALSGSDDKSVILWDTDNGAEIHRFLGHNGAVNSVAFSPDGQYALSGSIDNSLILWDAKTARAIRRLTGHGQNVLSVAFSPDGQYALSGSADTTLILWNLKTGDVARRFRGHIDRVNSVAFSPDGSMALSGSAEGNLILWDVKSGMEIRRFLGHAGAVNSVAFSPDGKSAVSGSADKNLILWDVQRGIIVRIFSGHRDSVRTVAISADGKMVLSGSVDGVMIGWDLATGTEIQRYLAGGPGVLSVAFTPDSKAVLAGLADGSLVVSNAQSGEIMQHLEAHSASVNSVTFSPDGKTILSGSADGSLIQWWNHAPSEVIAWAKATHFIHTLTCTEREQYRVEPLCSS